MTFERDDIELVKLFLSRFTDRDGRTYTLESQPDKTERKAKAIEAIAVSKDGKRLAVEHTLIQVFLGQKQDDIPFLTAFERLEKDQSLRLPNRFIDVQPPAFAVPKGFNWEIVGQRVYEWFKQARQTFPLQGDTWHTIPEVGFELKVLVQTMELPDSPGMVLVGRVLPKDRPFIQVLQKALFEKVPKLVATPAEKHLLLLEDNSTAIGFSKLTKGIDETVEKLPELKGIDAIWTIHTIEWKRTGDALFAHVWPGGVQERFWIKDDRFVSKAASTTDKPK